MFAFSVIDAAFVAAISFIMWQYEQRAEVKTGQKGGSEIAAEKEDKQVRDYGGVEPYLVDALELELIKRSVPLPDRSLLKYVSDPSAYYADLQILLANSQGRSQSLQPTSDKKMDIAVPDSARTIGHTIMDMVQFNEPRLYPTAPPPVEQFDF